MTRNGLFIASTIRPLWDAAQNNSQSAAHTRAVLTRYANSTATKLAAENPKFNRDEFLQACGVL